MFQNLGVVQNYLVSFVNENKVICIYLFVQGHAAIKDYKIDCDTTKSCDLLVGLFVHTLQKLCRKHNCEVFYGLFLH